jgi:hypothetical protein
MSEVKLMCEGLWQSVDVWTVAVVLGIPAISKIIIFCVALHGAPPENRPKIISALAKMFRWRRRR